MNFTELTSEQSSKLNRIRHLALDMDGTIYRGKSLFSYTADALAMFRRMGICYTFLTNNSSRSVADYLVGLKALGLEADADQIYTSSLAAIEYIEREFGKGSRLFVLGTLSLRIEFQNAGFEIVTEYDDSEPDAVVVGFDTELTYQRLCKAAYWVNQGKPYIATHPDKVCPTDEELVLVDCGSVCACIREATSRSPDIVLGKPDPSMVTGVLKRQGLQPGELAVVGDRLYTDMAMAIRACALGVLVLSGESKLSDLEDDAQILVFDNIYTFARALAHSGRSPLVPPGNHREIIPETTIF